MKINKWFIIPVLVLLMGIPQTQAQSSAQKPIRLAISGMTHGHIAFYFRPDRQERFSVGGCL